MKKSDKRIEASLSNPEFNETQQDSPQQFRTDPTFQQFETPLFLRLNRIDAYLQFLCNFRIAPAFQVSQAKNPLAPLWHCGNYHIYLIHYLRADHFVNHGRFLFHDLGVKPEVSFFDFSVPPHIVAGISYGCIQVTFYGSILICHHMPALEECSKCILHNILSHHLIPQQLPGEMT